MLDRLKFQVFSCLRADRYHQDQQENKSFGVIDVLINSYPL